MKFYKLSYVNFNQNDIILLCDLTCLLLLFECFVTIIVCILIKSSSLLLKYLLGFIFGNHMLYMNNKLCTWYTMSQFKKYCVQFYYFFLFKIFKDNN